MKELKAPFFPFGASRSRYQLGTSCEPVRHELVPNWFRMDQLRPSAKKKTANQSKFDCRACAAAAKLQIDANYD
jgi:hypothetical protein